MRDITYGDVESIQEAVSFCKDRNAQEKGEKALDLARAWHFAPQILKNASFREIEEAVTIHEVWSSDDVLKNYSTDQVKEAERAKDTALFSRLVSTKKKYSALSGITMDDFAQAMVIASEWMKIAEFANKDVAQIKDDIEQLLRVIAILREANRVRSMPNSKDIAINVLMLFGESYGHILSLSKSLPPEAVLIKRMFLISAYDNIGLAACIADFIVYLFTGNDEGKVSKKMKAAWEEIITGVGDLPHAIDKELNDYFGKKPSTDK